jgi:hemolysin III
MKTGIAINPVFPNHPEWRVPSMKEEIVNCVSHGIAAPAAIYVTYLMLDRLGPDSDPRRFWSIVVYGVSLFLVFLLSALYHGFAPIPAAKRALQCGDHISIFLIIAGSYTPFALGPLWELSGLRICVFVWATALVGIVGKLFFFEWFLKISLPYFLGMGWAALFAARDIIRAFSRISLSWILAGAIMYTVGCFFYSRDKPYDHTIFHGFVLLGSAFTYMSVWATI